MSSIEQKVKASNYLLSLQTKYPELSVSEPAPLEKLSTLLDEIATTTLAFQTSDQSSKGSVPIQSEIEIYLIRAKACFAWYWALAELQQIGSFRERGEFQTRFAELSIDLALLAAWHTVAHKYKEIQKILRDNNGVVPGFFLLGLGKLGGHDLNFSSDVDLIAYFDPNETPLPATLGASFLCHRVCQALTKMLGQNGRVDLIWRLDWRLRPNASATTLAMSTSAALDYYFYRASPWHRLALMKARVVAGDVVSGDLFLRELTPFVWRQNLDYRALDELGEIKNKIKREHPSLRAERAWEESVNDDVLGFSVKLGTGGIREIEFVANALQLVWGGKHQALRTPNTLQALDQLEQHQFIDTKAAQQLRKAYVFLRSLENALQLVDNQQTHSIPTNEANTGAIVALMSASNWDALVAKLNQHRQLVHAQFELIFAEQASASGPTIEWPESLSEAALETVKDWERGFVQYGVSIEVRHKLKSLIAALAASLAQFDDANKVVTRLHDFFRSLPQGEQYFRLLAESPPLLSCIVPPLLYSPPMTALLKQSPHIVDCFLHSDHLEMSEMEAGTIQFDSDFVRSAPVYETALERMRRFVNEQLYQLYLGFLQGELSARGLQNSLTVLAKHTLDLAMDVVADDMGLSELPVTVIGMGKMGVGRMAPQSDMDLIFVFDPNLTDLHTATRFVGRLQTAVSTPMREGVVYELDTRLRPSGKSGAPTVSIDSFRSHQLQRARSWEHIAMVSADVVGGNQGLANQIREVKTALLSTQRNRDQFLRDAKKMWLRISEHRLAEVGPEVMFSKLRVGGLMQAEYLAACRVLTNPRPDPEQNFYTLIDQAQPHQSLNPAIEFWQVLQLWERLLGWQQKAIDAIPNQYLDIMLQQVGCDSSTELIDRQVQVQAEVERGLNDIFSSIDADWSVDDWEEAAVDWQTD